MLTKQLFKRGMSLLASVAMAGALLTPCALAEDTYEQPALNPRVKSIVDHVYSSGGVAGYVYDDVFADCSFSGSITAENISGQVGGVCGTLSCTGERLVSHASIEVRHSPVLSACGGVVGLVGDAALRDSVNNGSVTVYGQAASVGGVCGQICAGSTNAKDENGKTLEDENGKWIKVPANGEIIGCTNNGSVTAAEAENVGGIAGSGYSCVRPIGTIIIQGCVNNSEILGLENVGGITGEVFSEYGNYQLQQCTTANATPLRRSITPTARIRTALPPRSTRPSCPRVRRSSPATARSRRRKPIRWLRSCCADECLLAGIRMSS